MAQNNSERYQSVVQRLPDGNGYTWTLPFRLGEMLHMAEELFGPRDSSYTIHAIEFVPDGPYIFYPLNHGSIKKPYIIIRLGDSAAKDVRQTCYQMAHETIHLLAPSGGQNANNFEEEVACYFAAYYMKRKLNEPTWRPTLPSYKRALEIIKPRLDKDIYCIRRLRKNHLSFRDISKEEISKEFPKLTSEDVDFLMSKFDRNSGS